MKTVSVDLYEFGELTPEAQTWACDAWRVSSDFRFALEAYQSDAQADFKAITKAITDFCPPTARDVEPHKVTEARTICLGVWRTAWGTCEGCDMVSAMQESDFIHEMKLALAAYDAMRDLEDSIETDSADYSESVYGLEAMICDLRDCFMADLRRARDRIMDSEYDNVSDPEYFEDLAIGNEWLFTADGERWDR